MTKLDRLFTDCLAEGRFAGASALVRQRGVLVWRGDFGFRDREKELNIDGDSIFRLASMTKPVIAAAVIAFPLMYRNARAAFEQVDMDLIYAGRTLGLSDWKIFWKVVFPAARPGIISGTVLTFARAMGEYGATSMLAGNIPGKTGTISQRIAMVIQDGNYAVAGFWTLVVLVIAMAILLLINIFSSDEKRGPGRW